MTTSPSFLGLFVVLCGTHMVASAAAADAAPAAAGKTAIQVCESAVTEAIQKSRGQNAKQVQFGVVVSPFDFENGVQGKGRYHGVAGSMPFTYSCTLDPQTHRTTGVIFKDTGEPVRTAEKPWQADLTNISPEVCEAAAAAAVKDKFPRAVNVALSSQSRQLTPAPNAHTYLHGQGRLDRAVGMPPSAFTYRCEVDTASGKFIGVQTDLVE